MAMSVQGALTPQVDVTTSPEQNIAAMMKARIYDKRVIVERHVGGARASRSGGATDASERAAGLTKGVRLLEIAAGNGTDDVARQRDHGPDLSLLYGFPGHSLLRRAQSPTSG